MFCVPDTLGLLIVNEVVGARDGIGGGFLLPDPSTWLVPLTITLDCLSWFAEVGIAGGGIERGSISEGWGWFAGGLLEGADLATLLLPLTKCSPPSTQSNFMTSVCPVFLIRLTTWR